MTGPSWFTAGRGVLHQVCRSPAIVAAGVGSAAVWLVSRSGGNTQVPAAAMVTLVAVHHTAAHVAATVLGLAVPIAAVVVTLVGQQTLLQHRRALMAAFPDATGTRSAHWFVVMIGVAVGVTMVGSALPSAVGLLVGPAPILWWLLPGAIAITGLQVFTGEITRQPFAGLATGILWMVVSFGAENLVSIRPPHPVALLMLTPATTYPRSGGLQHTDLLTVGLGVLFWAAATAVAHYNRKQGWDV